MGARWTGGFGLSLKGWQGFAGVFWVCPGLVVAFWWGIGGLEMAWKNLARTALLRPGSIANVWAGHTHSEFPSNSACCSTCASPHPPH